MSTDLVLGGCVVDHVADRVLRYCGCRWSGGPPETWAWPYFDEVVAPRPDVVDPVDVLAAAALHPGLSRSDLAYFVAARDELSVLLAGLPTDVALADADEALHQRVVRIGSIDPSVSLTLLSKVLHHVRPHLVPMVDRHVLDWYRPITRERSARAAWPGLIEALTNDLGIDANATAIAELQARVTESRPVTPSALRVVDIAIWMGGR